MVSVNGVISYAVVTLLIGALSAAVNIKNSDNNNNSIASVPCSSFTACEICAANNCTWVIDKNCAERCTKSGANMRGSINSAPTCKSRESCTSSFKKKLVYYFFSFVYARLCLLHL